MMELLFIACIGAVEPVCEERSIGQLPEVSLMSCLFTAPRRLAEWTETHPDHQITRWSCSYRQPGQRDI